MLGKLFLAFLQIGCMSFGGGYASLPLIQQVVLQHHWLNKTEMAQLITISQMTPGPIAVNAATFVGQGRWVALSQLLGVFSRLC